MFDTIRTLILCVFGLLALIAVLLSLPKSRLADILLPVLGWSVAAGSLLYVVSPIDILPDFIPFAGWLDDGGAIVTAIGGVAAALHVKEDKKKQAA